ncbi:MAG: tetratricopeptide repeat protein, partial [Thermoanaerobaculales bacterium]
LPPPPAPQPLAAATPEPAPRPVSAPAAAPPRATVALARLFVQQQDLAGASSVLARVLERDPSNVEARELLALLNDMMEPSPEPLPALSPRERKIAALQRWLASITLGQEEAVP